jgi:uncharacterized protein YjbJ (UPF0337 family)
MNWDQIKGDWKQMTGKVKEKWGKLTDNELTVIAGQRLHARAEALRGSNEMVGRTSRCPAIVASSTQRVSSLLACRLKHMK